MNVINREMIPKLDLHGETRDSARVLILEFINDNYLLGNLELAIIHGVGLGILKKEVQEVLKNHKKVKEYGLDMFNPGVTLVKLNTRVDDNKKVCYNNQHKLEGDTYV